ncbi:response regulator transcription factor [Pseudothermotoga elfii]
MGLKKEKVLIVEDNEDLLNSIKEFLLKEGYDVSCAVDAEQAFDLVIEDHYDCLVVDVLLPRINGFEFVEHLRESLINVPILILTALDAINDKVRGLSCGADDYLTKPFDFRELLARIKSLIRRSNITKGEEINFKGLKLNSRSRQVTVEGTALKMSKREFALLELFLRNPGIVFSREEIMEKVWENEKIIKSNVIDVYILYLRNKLKPYGYDRYIQTVPGYGYRFCEE